MFHINYRLLISIIITASLLFFSQPSLHSASLSSPSPTIVLPQTASLSVIVDNQAKTFSLPITATSSALSLLQTAAAHDQIPLVIKTSSIGILVESISGLPNTSTRSWTYFINNQSTNITADSYLIQPGDTIEWKYVEPR